jgi:virginiamycin B lyase
MVTRTHLPTLATLSLVAVSAVAQANAQPNAQTNSPRVPMREWTVPWEKTRPRDAIAATNGLVWFVGQEGNYVASLDPNTGRFNRIAIDSGMFPHNVVLDKRGGVWFTGNRNGTIGYIEPSMAKQTRRIRIPDTTIRDPHTLTVAPDGDLWFTAQSGNVVGRLSPTTGRIRLVPIPAKNSRPYGIVMDSHGHPWFDLFGTNRIGTIDPTTMRLREFPLPNDRARPRRIAITSDDMVWYVDYARGFLGRLDPRTGAVKEWPNPGGPVSLPYGMTVDDQDRLWFVETGKQPNRLVGFDPRDERFFGFTDVGSGGGTIRHMTFDRTTGQIWFGTDAGTIGRATVGLKGKPISD